MKWIGQNIYDLVSKFRNTVDFSEDVTFYQPVNNADPEISIGASDDERLKIEVSYQGTTTQMAQIVSFKTFTESATAHDGRFVFSVDQTGILKIQDGGIDFYAGKGIGINGVDILTDNGSGTATLNNIDALDATTIATFNAALTAGDITGVTAGTGLSGGGTSGAVTLNVDAAQTGITSLGTLSGLTLRLDNKLNFRDGGSVISSPTANDLAISATDITLDASSSILVQTSDLTMYDAVNDGNPTISLGSAAANRFEMVSTYNSGAQTLDSVSFNSYTTSGSANDGKYLFRADEVLLMALLDAGLTVYGDIFAGADGASITSQNSTASSATEGGKLTLRCDDGAAMGDDHRLGVVEFSGAEDASNNRQTGARIQAMCDAAWSASENGTRLEFYTMDGNASSELSLTLDSDKLATFAGGVTVTGTITGDVTGDLTGEAATVATIAGLAPNTATTQATQAAITTCANLASIGTITTGVWNGTAIEHAYIGADAIEGDNIADDAVDSEHYTDGSIDTAHIADDQVTFAKALGVTPNVFGSAIKLIPSDFMANDDGGNTKFGVGYVESAGDLYGMRAANNDTELYAFVSIPQGMKATDVIIHAKQTLAVAVFVAQINATTMEALETGNCNTSINITDTNSTATNFLVIQVTTTAATNSKVYGGLVTIAAQ